MSTELLIEEISSPVQTRWRRFDKLEQLAVIFWGIGLIGSLIRLSVSPIKHSVYPNFSIAASRWVNGLDLYASTRIYDFRYSPLVAITFTPLLPLGDRAGGLIWCLFNAVALIWGVLWWLQKTPERFSGNQRGLLFLILFPLALGNLASNQSNALIIGMLLIAITSIQLNRFSLAAVMIAAAFFFKIYPLSLGLLLILIHPRKLAGRLAFFVALGLLLPYLFQRPTYVTAMYREWAHYLMTEDRSIAGAGRAYRDVQFLLNDLSIAVTQPIYRIIELGAAAVIGACCLIARSKFGASSRTYFITLTLSLCWMTAFGPATESMTYLLIAPIACYLLIQHSPSRHAWTGWLYLACYLMLLYPPFAGIFGPHSMLRSPRLKSIQPIAVLLLLAGVMVDSFRPPRRTAPRIISESL